MPLVADVEPSIDGDFAARELTGTAFDFLQAGLALSGLSRVGYTCSFNEVVKLA